jgi:hypothetical protein
VEVPPLPDAPLSSRRCASARSSPRPSWWRRCSSSARWRREGSGVDDAPAVADLPLAVDGPLPRLGERGPAEGAPDGLAIAPAITEVRPAPGRRTELVHVVTNGTDAPLDLTIDVPTAPLGRDGPRVEVLDDPPAPP